MKYENFAEAQQIVKDIDAYKSLYNSLDESWYIAMSINHLPKHNYLEIQMGVHGEYTDLATEFCDKIKERIKTKIEVLTEKLDTL